MKTSSAFCRTCQRQTAHHQQTANHLVHALVTLFLCGLWLPVWVLMALSPGPQRCGQCGSVTRTMGDKLVRGVVYGFVGLLVLLAVVVAASAKFGG